MVKIQELSQNIRMDVVTKYNAGISVEYLSKLYNISRQTIYYQINKYKKNNSFDNRPRSGRPRVTTLKQDRKIIASVRNNPLLTPKAVSISLNQDYNIAVSRKTVQRRLKESNFRTYVVKTVPYISPKNKIKRLEFAKQYVNKPISFWEKVLWTDESTFEYHGSKKKQFCRLPQKLRQKHALVNERIPHGGGSVMFWGCVCNSGLGNLVPIDGTMNKDKYLNILNNYAFISGDTLIGESFILQQDNAPCHKARLITDFLRDTGVNTLDWPPQSPDLNIIENVWSYIKGKRSPCLTRTREETINEIEGLWKDISLETIQNLVKSIPRRLQSVIEVKGGYIFH